jgi:hypothetical protein
MQNHARSRPIHRDLPEYLLDPRSLTDHAQCAADHSSLYSTRDGIRRLAHLSSFERSDGVCVPGRSNDSFREVRRGSNS